MNKNINDELDSLVVGGQKTFENALIVLGSIATVGLMVTIVFCMV